MPLISNKNKEHAQHGGGRPVLKCGAGADAAIVQERQKNREADAQQQPWKKDGLARHAIKLHRVELGKMYAAILPTATASHGHTMK